MLDTFLLLDFNKTRDIDYLNSCETIFDISVVPGSVGATFWFRLLYLTTWITMKSHTVTVTLIAFQHRESLRPTGGYVSWSLENSMAHQ